jgi:hypothetical protein
LVLASFLLISGALFSSWFGGKEPKVSEKGGKTYDFKRNVFFD